MKTELLEPKAGPPPAALPSSLVLVVDDEAQNRSLLRDALEARGYEVAEAEHGAEALRMVAERPPDVILLDLMMPKMDGFEVCRRLKGNRRTAPIPILMVTALSERKERLMGIEAGANDFLNKPVDYQDVTLRVTNALYTKHLFDRLQVEQEKSERLLLNILPEPIALRMKNGETTIADHYPEVTVLLADLVGFTTLSTLYGPDEVVCLLNEIFCAFDQLVEQHCLEKVKTVGDAYLAAGGLPLPHPRHAEAVAELALNMREALADWNRQYNTSLRTRIGINTGPVVAGVIGRKKFAYDLWGDTVNLACQLEACGKPGAIQVAQPTYELLRDKYRFQSEIIEIKGRGAVTAYLLCD